MSEHSIIILAGGDGKRMNTTIPKVCCLLGGKPLIIHIIERAIQTSPNDIFIVVGKHKAVIQEMVSRYTQFNVTYVEQQYAKGTGHALLCCLPFIVSDNDECKYLVLCGDVPLISKELLINLLNTKQNTIAVTYKDDPLGLGRVTKKCEYVLDRIIEEKDCNKEEKQIKLTNCGIYVVSLRDIKETILKIKNNNAQKEYYLPDIFHYISEYSKVHLYYIPKSIQYTTNGVNTQEQLTELETIYCGITHSV
jgi:bifunctional N-acetylglucosamine-1-phosphate-uridyltransferase/glucosamine-1-phosphate-acetyltransferase GlmU-like protein